MIGFMRDDVPRDNEAIQHDSGLWVAGAGYLERLDREPKDPEGGIASVTAVAPAYVPPAGRAASKPVQA